MSRRITDALQKSAAALPAAGNNNTTPVLDLSQGAEVPENIELKVSTPALPALADTKTLTLTVQESNDEDANFAAAPWAPPFVLTGAGGAGVAEFEQRLRPPSTAKRYLRLAQAIVADGGDNTALEGSLEVLF